MRASASATGDEQDVIYASLLPGTATSGAVASVRAGSGALLWTSLSDGGFDPVALLAPVGDTVEVQVHDAGGAVVYAERAVVAAARRPVVVRTDPPPRKRDVPLNAGIVIVFSEPVDTASLTTSSVRLDRGTLAVSGTVSVLQGNGAAIGFEPDAPLTPNTDYSLSVTSAVRDLQGESLGGGVTVTFTTGAALTAPPASIELSPDTVYMTSLTYQMTATVRDSVGNVLTNQLLAWSTGDARVLAVSSTGLLTAVAQGYSYVQASVNGVVGSASVQVNTTSVPPLPGELRVTAATDGADLDPNGYVLTIAGNGQQVPTNGATTFPNVPLGDYTIELRDVASNCAVAGANPRLVTISAGGVTDAGFAITCSSGLPGLLATISTTGADVDPDGYLVDVPGFGFGQVSPNDTANFTGIPPGDWSVVLRNIAPNCAVSGLDSLAVTVVRGASVEVSFGVTCSARPAGTVQVTTLTLGDGLDADGFTVSLDGGPARPIGLNDATSFAGVAAGSHTVELGNVASNCLVVSGSSVQTITLVQDSSAAVAFSLVCVANAGSVRVTTATTGVELDPNGYLVEIEGNGQTIATNGTYFYQAVHAGSHPIVLSDIASNCTVTGSNPQTVTVIESDSVDVAFALSCAATSGVVRVTTTTTGATSDPDGYVVQLGFDEQAVGVNDTVVFSAVPIGNNTVWLSGVDVWCAASPYSQSITVRGGDTVDVAFTVQCPAFGALRVTTTATGAAIGSESRFYVCMDQHSTPPGLFCPNGYLLTGPVPGAATTVVGNLVFAGTHTISVMPVIPGPNCTVLGANPQTIDIVAGDTVAAAFAFNCEAVDLSSSLIAFSSDRGFSSGIYLTRPDGSGLWRLSYNYADQDYSPAWSRDGARIAFSRKVGVITIGGFQEYQFQIFLVNADGSGLTNLTNHNNGVDNALGPIGWSPDGSRIVFTGDGGVSGYDLYVINVDGSGLTTLTPDAAADLEPSWAPDGTKIVFRSNRDGPWDLYVMNPDGSGVTRLTNDALDEYTPAWSPDGTKIAFQSSRDGNAEIYVMNADGSGVTRLTNDPAADGNPAWSPDGTKIVFQSERDGNVEIYVMNADGSGVTRVTNDVGRDWLPAWRPVP